MKASMTNSTIVLRDADPKVKKRLTSLLTYKDKSKLYEFRRMSKYYMSDHPKLLAVKAQISGNLYEEKGRDLIMSAGFYDKIKELGVTSIFDQRHETGAKIALPWKTKPFDLRQYQEEAVELLEEYYRGLINLATGLGKTLIAIYAIRRIKRKTLVVCPGESIAEQFYEGLCSAFGEEKIGYYGGGKKKIRDITVGIAASVNNDIELFQKEDLGLVIFDEVHHIAANTFFNIGSGLSHVGKVFGLTATDFRSDGKDIMITAGCGEVLLRRDIKWGVENGWLAKPYFIVRKVPTEGYNYKNDKLKNYKAHVLNNQLMKQQIEGDIRKFLEAGKQVLCLVAEVAHGRELSKALGLPFATGVDKKSQEYVNQLNSGKIPGLIGTAGKISEGTDMQGLEILVLASFIASKGPVIQAVGRGLRKTKDKSYCLILDYVPEGSSMLTRHAYQRVQYYQEITDKVKII